MRRSAITLVLLSVLTLLAEAQTNLSSVIVKWKKNGVWISNTYYPDAIATITPDHGSTVNVTITRTANAPVPSEFTVSDWNNGATHTQTSSSTSVTFTNCAGSLNTQLWAMVNIVEGVVRINVEWAQPAKPDLTISQLTVNASTNPIGKVFQIGESVTVRSIVWNVGGLQAGGSDLAYFIKTTADNTTGSPFITSQVPSIPSGKGSSQQSYYTFTSNDLGTRYFVLEADHSAQVNEASESNNVRSFGPFQVVSPPSMNISPSNADYGNVLIRECSQENTFVLINDGGTALNGQVTLENGEHFSLTAGGGSFSLNPGQSRTIKAKFCPKTAGQKTDKIRVFADNYGSHPLQANLTGNASNPPEIIVGISDEFSFDTRNLIRNSGGIFLKIIETAGTSVVNKVGYCYSFLSKPNNQITGSTALFITEINKVPVNKNGFVFLSPPVFPDNAEAKNDFLNEILLFNEKDIQIGHIAFEYSFEWEGMHSRHAVIFFHNDDDICKHPDGPPHYFPYSKDSPHNISKTWWNILADRRYNYYKDGEYPVSMLIPPHFTDTEDEVKVEGYRLPISFEDVKPLLFVHGLTGTFSYQKKHGAIPEYTSTKGDQVSYWHHTEQKVNHMTGNGGGRMFHGWQFYYPYEDDLRHCGKTLRQGINYLFPLYEKYEQKIGIVAHSMGGLVTLEFLTTNSEHYNQERISKLLISQTPNNGSILANRVCWNEDYGDIESKILGKVAGAFGFDHKAPCYRDLSIGSDFLHDLHSRDWKALLDFNNSDNIRDDVFTLVGLTDNEYRKAYLDKWYVPINKINQIHTEALDHDDGIVSFSSVSLLDKDIGLAGFYGNHDDGKFGVNGVVGTNTSDDFMPNIIYSYFNTNYYSDFENNCLNNPSIEIFIDNNKNILKPQINGGSFSNLRIDRPNVNFQKGMVTLYSESINEDVLYLFERQPWHGTMNPLGLDLVLTPLANGPNNVHEFYYKRLEGRFIKNIDATKSVYKNRYYYAGNSLWRTNTGFDKFSKDPFISVNLTYYDKKSYPAGHGNIYSFSGSYLHHKTVGLSTDDPFTQGTTEYSPTKYFIPGLKKNSQTVTEIYVDDQTILADFILYSEYADVHDIPCYISLYAPNGAVVDSNSINTNYFRNPSTGMNILTVNHPEPGKWTIVANFDSDEELNISFIGLSRFASSIKAGSYLNKDVYDIHDTVLITGFIKIPEVELISMDNLNAFVEIEGPNGIKTLVNLENIEIADTAIIFSGSFTPDSTGTYHYILIIEGIYNGYRFERAIYGKSAIYDMTPYLSIPDQDLGITNISFELNLMKFLYCPGCIQDSIRFEVSQESSEFPEEDLFYSFESENDRFSLMVSQSAASSEAMFTVECFTSDSLIVSRTFKVRYTAPGIPRGLSTYLLTRQSAGLSWIATGTETQWEVMYGPEGFNPETEGTLIEGVPEEKFPLTGLPGSTAYDFYVRAVYDEGAVKGPWSWPGTFTTAHLITSSAGLYGTIEPSGETEVLDNSIQTYHILPDEHYHLSELIIDGEPAETLTEYTFRQVNRDHTIYAGFSVNFYTLEYRSGKNGTLSGELSQNVEYNNHGTPVEAIPDDGYYFSGWSDGVMENPRTDLHVSGNKKVTALFNVLTSSSDVMSKLVQIFPNPATHEFMVNSAINVSRIEMADITGKMVYQQKVNANLWRISCSSLDDGIYIIFVHMDKEVITRKIVITK